MVPNNSGKKDAGLAVEIGFQDAVEEVVEAGAVPPTVHVGVAEAERTLPADEVEQGWVVDADVAGLGAVEMDAG